MVLLIYLYIFVVVAAASATLFYLLANCVSVIQRAVFRNTKQRRRGRLDPGCIHLGTGEAPIGSLKGGERKGDVKKKCIYCIAAKYIIYKHFHKYSKDHRATFSTADTGTEGKYNDDHTMSPAVI